MISPHMGVYSDIFIYVDSDHFGGFKIMNFNNFWVFRKTNIFGGMMKLWIFFFFFFFLGGGGVITNGVISIN